MCLGYLRPATNHGLGIQHALKPKAIIEGRCTPPHIENPITLLNLVRDSQSQH